VHALDSAKIYLSQRAPFTLRSRLLHSLPQLLFKMGVLAVVAGPVSKFTSESSTTAVVAAGFASFILLSVVLNVLKQLLLKKPNEPPVVFHWFPIIGSTVTYGIDPYKFFFAQQKKVCGTRAGIGAWLTLRSMAMSSPSSSLAAR
jgi:hypothetical protein